jgi:BirA family transcriptional regulator, biotin operon repressor / biotin---[acetyl-CoA-carboxylase] ligase
MDEVSLMVAMEGLPVPQVRYFEEIGSSNEEALAWVSQAERAGGAQDGCLVVANSQSQGRGRLGRRWITEPGSSLAFSLILRLTPAEIERLAYFSPLGALAISQALESIGLAPMIKWPNDVLLERRKVAGILVETAWLGEELQGVVIGIGLNIAPESVPPAEQLLFPAISVQEAAGSVIDRVSLLRAILTNIFFWRTRLFEPAFFEGWEERLAFRDEWVRLEETGGGIMTGQVVGLDAGGSLLLRKQDGKMMAVNVGDVHLRPFGPQQ